MKRTDAVLLFGAMFMLMSTAVAAAEMNHGRKNPVMGDPKKSYGDVDVILYETSWCPSCNKARQFLRDLGVSLVEYDIEKDEARRDEMIAKSGSRNIPVIDVEGIIIRGYAPNTIKEAVERRRRE